MEYNEKATRMTDSYSLWANVNNCGIDSVLFFILPFLVQVCYLVLLFIKNLNMQK